MQPTRTMFLRALIAVLVLTAGSLLAEIEKFTCDHYSSSSSGSVPTSIGNFLFHADSITAIVGAFTHVPLAIEVANASIMSHAYCMHESPFYVLAELRFRTNYTNLELGIAAEFTTQRPLIPLVPMDPQAGDKGWYCTSLRVTFEMQSGNAGGKRQVVSVDLSEHELEELGWESTSFAKGLECQDVLVPLNEVSSLEIHDLRLFPLANLGQNPGEMSELDAGIGSFRQATHFR